LPLLPLHRHINCARSTHCKRCHYVAAIYQRKWYIGKVFSSDESDRTVEISFMVQSKEFFKWPERSDVIWLDVNLNSKNLNKFCNNSKCNVPVENCNRITYF
jgi:hypothetical protein